MEIQMKAAVDTSKILIKYTKNDNSFRLSFAPTTIGVELPFTSEHLEIKDLAAEKLAQIGDFSFVVNINNPCPISGCANAEDKAKMQEEMAKVQKFVFSSLMNYPSVTSAAVNTADDLKTIVKYFNDNNEVLRNFETRPEGIEIDKLVMHYTAVDAPTSFQFLTTPRGVSAHYLVYENGEIMQLVAEENIAWHAGISAWKGVPSVNKYSIGIEIVNTGINEQTNQCTPFTEVQIKAVEVLSLDILNRHKAITPTNVVGHSDVGPTRKIDPGHCFPWKQLAEKGIGVFPNIELPSENKVIFSSNSKGSEVAEWKQRITKLGYEVSKDDNFGLQEQKVAETFHSHYFAEYPNDNWDTQSDIMLTALLGSISSINETVDI
jgi:N-acetyl-anhydromuramyl-L-alanine amidase AmpD